MRTVNPKRIRRYLNRTLTRPEPEYHLTDAEARQVADYNDRWFKDDLYDDLALPGVFAWRNDVTRWAKAQGLDPMRDLVWTYTPAHAKPWEACVVHWEVRAGAR